MISTIVNQIKSNSSGFINANKLLSSKFYLQEGYGAFTYSQSHVGQLYNYIANQSEHHKKATFKEEYISLLKKFEISYKEKYLFDW